MRIATFALAVGVMVAGTAQADEFRLNSNQRIACGRGFMAGKLQTATCRSYAYVFNAKTSEHWRCSASLTMTRDTKEVVNVAMDGGCLKKKRIFDGDSTYVFDVAETEPPNTNSFFGAGGVALWAADTNSRKLRGCFTIPTGFTDDVTRCVDMSFE